MARENRQRLRKKFVYFFLNGKVHKVLRLSRAKDEVVAWSYLDNKRMMYSYAQVDKHMERAYGIKEVSKIIGRHRVTIEISTRVLIWILARFAFKYNVRFSDFV